MGDLNTDRLADAGDVTAEDLAIFDSLEPDGADSEKAVSGGESGEDSPEVQGEPDTADPDSDEDSEDGLGDEDAGEDDANLDDSDEEGSGADEDGAGDTEDAGDADGAEDIGDDADLEPDAEVVKSATETYEQTLQQAQEEVAHRFLPIAQQAASRVQAVEAQIQELEERYATPDEDGYIPAMTVADQRRIVQLEHERIKANEALDHVKAQVGPALQQAERETHVRANLQAYPKLQAVEAGFREALNRGIEFTSVAEAIEVSAAIMRAQGKAPAPVKKTPRVKPGEAERAALEASLARKKAGAITSGRSTSTARTPARAESSYRGLPPVVAEGLKFWDKALAEG